MSFNAHENTVLAAPRPVRLAAPFPYPHFHAPLLHKPQSRAPGVRIVSAPVDALECLKLSDESTEDLSKLAEPIDRDLASPRASPRSTLPSEALEEFLSILNPSGLFFPPTSPILRASNANVSHTFFAYHRSTPFSASLPAESLGLTLVDHADDARQDSENVVYPFKMISTGPLASPVSRLHTRNPFQRHACHDAAMAGFLNSRSISTPSPLGFTLSPSIIPLPSPTPDEMEPDVTP